MVVDGDLVTLPDIALRTAYRPTSPDAWLATIAASVRYVATLQHSVVPGAGGAGNDARSGRSTSVPVSLSLGWNERGALTTGISMAATHRVDSLPGSLLDAWTREMGADVTRNFPLPREWELRSGLRTRVAWQRTASTNWVETSGAALRSRLVDNGREAISFNADTDVAENLTFSLQGARIVTFDNNLNRRLTQTVLSAVLQVSFFAGEMR